MPTLHIEADDLNKLLGGETIQHPVTGLRVVLDKEAIDVVAKYQQPLEQIARLWPDPGMCAEIAPQFVGPNDGRIRADLLWSALNIARAALNLPTYARPEHWKETESK